MIFAMGELLLEALCSEPEDPPVHSI